MMRCLQLEAARFVLYMVVRGVAAWWLCVAECSCEVQHSSCMSSLKGDAFTVPGAKMSIR